MHTPQDIDDAREYDTRIQRNRNPIASEVIRAHVATRMVEHAKLRSCVNELTSQRSWLDTKITRPSCGQRARVATRMVEHANNTTIVNKTSPARHNAHGRTRKLRTRPSYINEPSLQHSWLNTQITRPACVKRAHVATRMVERTNTQS